MAVATKIGPPNPRTLTPDVTAFIDRVTVLLDPELGKCSWFAPEKITLIEHDYESRP